MSLCKYISNRFLTLIENLLLGVRLSEFHRRYRAYSREMLETLPIRENSDDFVFDNECLAQAVAFGFRMGEISCPTKYFPEASSINFRRSVIDGFGMLSTALKFRLHAWGWRRDRLFDPKGRTMSPRAPQLV